MVGYLGFALSDPLACGLIQWNLMRDLKGSRKMGKGRPRRAPREGQAQVGVDIPTRAEVRAIVGALDGKWLPILLTAIFAGLRASGLRWVDVDLAEREVHVRQRAGRYSVIGPPKSAAGERVIPIPPVPVAALTAWQQKVIKWISASPSRRGGAASSTTRTSSVAASVQPRSRLA